MQFYLKPLTLQTKKTSDMNESVIFMTLGGSAIVHFVITCVMGLFARHRVQYLCLAWVNGIFFGTTLVASFFSQDIAEGEPGILHPAMLLALLCACYLQSIYPLNISMPGFLQWERMWRYARPILVLLAIYIGAALMGSRIVYIYTAKDLIGNILSSDILLRLCALGLSIYYIVNIFLLPRRMARHANVPGYLLGYCVAMGLSVVFYTYVAIFYNLTLLAIYIILFTILNLYLMFRTLETLALQLPRPIISEVAEILPRRIRMQNRMTSTRRTSIASNASTSGCRITRTSGKKALSAETVFVRKWATIGILSFKVYAVRASTMCTTTSAVSVLRN